MTMRPKRLGLALAVALSLPSGSVPAAPDECLRYSDNPAVAACANQYGPGSPGPRTRTTSVAAPSTRSVPVRPDSDLRAVAVTPGGKPPPAPEPEAISFPIDREALTGTIVAGAVGGSLLILVALGAWRWSLTLTKSCAFCGAKLGRSARTCRRCFRAA